MTQQLANPRDETVATESSPGETNSLLAEFIARHNPACPACGYSLNKLTSERCPECGEPLALRLASSAPLSIPWAAGLIALAAGSGFFVLLPAVLLGFTRQEVVWLWSSTAGRVALGAVPIYVAALGAWLGMQQTIDGWPKRYRWAAACVCVGGLVFSVMLFGFCLTHRPTP